VTLAVDCDRKRGSMKNRFPRVILGCACAVLLSASLATGQSVTGSITGVVSDPSNAVVANATVTAHNLSTNVDTSATTNASGLYHIDFLPIGKYEVNVTAAGFSKQTIPAFSLEALQTVSFNVSLTVQGSSSSVQVDAYAPILHTEDYTLSGTFTENTISNFPLNGLDFSALTLYVPGAASTYGNTGTTNIERDTYYSDSVNMNGNRAQANNYTLEGIDINETFNNEISYSPAPASLAEVRVLTANTPAEFGNVNGAGVVSVLKSGTNHFHGSAYGYLQDYRFNANSWQNNNSGIPINPFSQDQFGGTFGGPILHNRLFFFVDYLGSRWHTGGIGTESVLTNRMRSGDFGELLENGYNIQLYDPLNNNAAYTGNQGVPILNPVAQFLLANPTLYPAPNHAPTDNLANNNYQAHQHNYKANNQGDAKLEYDINASNKVTGFYAMSTAYNGSTPVLAISFSGPNLYPTKLGGGNWVHTFSPSLINSLRIGFTRTVWAQNFSVDSTGQFGTNGNQKVGISFPNQTLPGYTYQSINGGLFAGGNPVYGGGLIDNTYSYIDALSWQKGRHYFTFGTSWLRYQNNYPTANNNGYLGNLNYNGNFTKNSDTSAGGYGGADFLLDRISSAAVTFASVNVGQRQWRVGTYFNDDFKLRPNLTISYGFRYELDEPWVEQNNKTGNIDEASGQLIYAHAVPAGAPAGAGLCKNRGCYNWNFHQFMPRLGWALTVNPRFVIRGGYSGTSFFEGNSSNQRLTSMTPFIQAMNVNIPAPTADSITPPLNTQTAFAQSAQAGGSYNVYPQNMQPAYIHNYNLTLEYAITPLLSLQAGYVGESGQHIEDYGNLNQWTVHSDPTSAPFYNNQYIGCNSNPATAICSNGLLVTESRAMMNYNGLQVVLRQRVSNSGLEYTVNYTYSKSMTNAVGNYGLNVAGYNADPGFQNYYDSGADYGPAGSDIKHNFTGTAVYTLPFGHGKKYLANSGRIVDEILGGWKITGAFMSYSGFPETITSSVSSNVNSYGLERANQYRPIHIVHRSLSNWFGTDPSAQPCVGIPDNGVCAFGDPAQNSFGTSSNGSVRGPGFHNVDMSIMKDFRIFGEHYLGFQFDAFNVFNIVSYGNPGTGIGSSSWGQIVQQNAIRSVERHLQFSARYTF
jgi:Carboxypeptidase regulatory-like domain